MKYNNDITHEQYQRMIGRALKAMGENILEFGADYYVGLDNKDTKCRLTMDGKTVEFFQIWGRGAYFSGRQILYYRRIDHYLELDAEASGRNRKVVNACLSELGIREAGW